MEAAMNHVRLVCFLSMLAVVVADPVSAHGKSRLQGTFSHDTSTDEQIHFSVADTGQITVVNRVTVSLSGDVAGALHAIVVIDVDPSTNTAFISGAGVLVGTIRGAAAVLEGTVALNIDLANLADGIRGVYNFRRDGGPILFLSGGSDGVLATGSYRSDARARHDDD